MFVKLIRKHNTDKQRAKAWLDAKSAEMLAQFGDAVSDVSHRWNGDVLEFGFRAGGMMRFKGTLTVTDSAYDLDLPFPLLAKGFEGRATAELNRWLDENLPPG